MLTGINKQKRHISGKFPNRDERASAVCFLKSGGDNLQESKAYTKKEKKPVNAEESVWPLCFVVYAKGC